VKEGLWGRVKKGGSQQLRKRDQRASEKSKRRQRGRGMYSNQGELKQKVLRRKGL